MKPKIVQPKRVRQSMGAPAQFDATQMFTPPEQAANAAVPAYKRGGLVKKGKAR